MNGLPDQGFTGAPGVFPQGGQVGSTPFVTPQGQPGVAVSEAPIPGQNALRSIFQMMYGNNVRLSFVEVEDYGDDIPHICPNKPGIKLLKDAHWNLVIQPKTPNQVPAQITVQASMCPECGKVIHPNWS